jgi:hypothetical protein
MLEGLLQAWAEGDVAAGWAMADWCEENGVRVPGLRSFVMAGKVEVAIAKLVLAGRIDGEWVCEQIPWATVHRFVDWLSRKDVRASVESGTDTVVISGDNMRVTRLTQKCGLAMSVNRYQIVLRVVNLEQRRRVFLALGSPP